MGGRFPSDWGVSAHPKADARTGELLFFNYGTDAPYLHYGVVDAEDRLAHYVDIPLPGPRLPHDMAFTENYAILNDCPLFWIPEALAHGKYVPRYHPDLPMRLGVLPRRGRPDQIVWFDADPTYVLHWTNAYEDGDEIVLEGFHQETPEPPDDGTGTLYRRLFRSLALDRMGTHLHRWRLNLRTGSLTEERLSESVTEFGMINPHHGGIRHRYTYAATGGAGLVPLRRARQTRRADRSRGALLVRRGRLRQRDGDGAPHRVRGRGRRLPDHDHHRHEPGPVRMPVFDARRPADGPLARIGLPERVSSGTHSTWAAGSDLPGWRDADRAGDVLNL